MGNFGLEPYPVLPCTLDSLGLHIPVLQATVPVQVELHLVSCSMRLLGVWDYGGNAGLFFFLRQLSRRLTGLCSLLPI